MVTEPFALGADAPVTVVGMVPAGEGENAGTDGVVAGQLAESPNRNVNPSGVSSSA